MKKEVFLNLSRSGENKAKMMDHTPGNGHHKCVGGLWHAMQLVNYTHPLHQPSSCGIYKSRLINMSSVKNPFCTSFRKTSCSFAYSLD